MSDSKDFSCFWRPNQLLAEYVWNKKAEWHTLIQPHRAILSWAIFIICKIMHKPPVSASKTDNAVRGLANSVFVTSWQTCSPQNCFFDSLTMFICFVLYHEKRRPHIYVWINVHAQTRLIRLFQLNLKAGQLSTNLLFLQLWYPKSVFGLCIPVSIQQ